MNNLVIELVHVKFMFIYGDPVVIITFTPSGVVHNCLQDTIVRPPDEDAGSVHVRNKFLTVRQLKRGDAQTLFECFKAAMEYIGITDWRNKLIGFGTDGASVNTGAGGLQGFMEIERCSQSYIFCYS